MNSLIKSQCDAHTSTVGSFGEILAGFLSFITLKKKSPLSTNTWQRSMYSDDKSVGVRLTSISHSEIISSVARIKSIWQSQD